MACISDFTEVVDFLGALQYIFFFIRGFFFIIITEEMRDRFNYMNDIKRETPLLKRIYWKKLHVENPVWRTMPTQPVAYF